MQMCHLTHYLNMIGISEGFQMYLVKETKKTDKCQQKWCLLRFNRCKLTNFANVLYTLLISLGTILNFQWMTSFAVRSHGKWLPKMKALLTLILQCIHIKRNDFTLYWEEYFLYTMSLWVCYRNFKTFVQRYSWIDDIEARRELI